MIDFPKWLRLDLTGWVDAAVYYLNVHYSSFFALVKGFLYEIINIVDQGLSHIPWWLFIIGCMLAARWLVGGWRAPFAYGALLFLVGALGYWPLLNETLAILITAVIFSLTLGFPAGVLVALFGRVEAALRPVFDAMQTMPVFVYMIPAVMLLGPGKVPAVLATVVYAVVPLIRLTCHGIRQVDQEMVEAARAFGSSRWQTLFKVEIPQARPTIMAGINQTMMLAVSMVVTSAMIGANGLGMEVLVAINRMESGRGLAAGLSIVILALVLDRLTQAAGGRD
jgi:ABC-type proline/glycine betaine transport system permease subunit